MSMNYSAFSAALQVHKKSAAHCPIWVALGNCCKNELSLSVYLTLFMNERPLIFLQSVPVHKGLYFLQSSTIVVLMTRT